MIVNGQALLQAMPLVGMETAKVIGPGGTSYGLGEAGYDIRIKQEIKFSEFNNKRFVMVTHPDAPEIERRWGTDGQFSLASSIEKFQMPSNLTGIVHDKSTWARKGLSVFNTVIEPGWNGFLTLELVYHGNGELIIPAGAGIAQVIFHEVVEPAAYHGKYSNQPDHPVSAIESV